jgi:Peptidase C39 family
MSLSVSLSASIADRSLRARRIAGIIVGTAILVMVVSWCRRGPISGSGGFPVPGEILLSMPQFLQGDPRWGDEKLADTPGTLGGEGCAVISASMVLSYHGMEVDPSRLNRFLREHNGYEGRGWIRWESASEFFPGIVEKAYEDAPSTFLIDWNLVRAIPSIVRIRRPDGITHFVVIVGKRGRDYLIRDPSGAGGGKVYPFRELGVPMEALRYYRRLSTTGSRTHSSATRLISAIAAR